MTSRLSRRCRSMGIVVSLLASFLGIAGCTSVPPQNELTPASDLSQLARQLRPADPNREPFTFSNEARAIEEDLGVGKKTSPVPTEAK
ncbi:MAG: hypothetical protein WHT09_01810 [Thermogutta sp.]